MVSNHSGEDYANARTRIVVGKISLLDQIAVLKNLYPGIQNAVILANAGIHRSGKKNSLKNQPRSTTLFAMHLKY